MRLAIVVFLAALQAAAAVKPVREVDSQAVTIAYQTSPGFSQGYVFWVGENGHLRLFSPDGQLAFEENVRQDMAPSIMSVAIDFDGTVAVSYSNGSRAGVDLLDGTGRPLRSFDTGQYLAAHMAFGDDHSIWTFGWQGIPKSLFKPAADYMTVHHYAADGRQLGEYLPRSLFAAPQRTTPACSGWQQQGIYVAKDRIGLLACNLNPKEWIELDLNGNLIGRWPTPELVVAAVAFTRDAHLYVQDVSNSPNPVLQLDRNASVFQPVSLPGAGEMCGADGDDLMFKDWNTGPIHFRWYHQP